jgi:transcriptional regulator with XRE-family HTH domain
VDRRNGREVAAQIATARVARRLTQDQLAAAAAVSVSLLRKIERGARPVTPRVLRALADALDVDPGQLAGTMVVTDSRVHAAIPAIRRALDAYDFPDDGPVRALPQLRRVVADAQRWRLSSQYARLAETLPPLVVELCRVLHGAESDRAEVAGLLTSALRSADGVAYKFGYHDLSARLVDLMHRTADQSDDELLAAAVAYVRTETYFASGNLTAALRSLDQAAAQFTPGTRNASAAYGALHMRAAVVAGRLGDPQAARAHLREAHAMAANVNEGVYYGTAFGPESVRVHDLAVSVELGDAQAALRTVAGWAPGPALPAERRSHYYLDLARAQLWAGRRDAAFASLRTARQIAPQHVRGHPHVRQVATTLLRLHRKPPADLVGFATWLGVA